MFFERGPFVLTEVCNWTRIGEIMNDSYHRFVFILTVGKKSNYFANFDRIGYNSKIYYLNRCVRIDSTFLDFFQMFYRLQGIF